MVRAGVPAIVPNKETTSQETNPDSAATGKTDRAGPDVQPRYKKNNPIARHRYHRKVHFAEHQL